MSDYKKAQEQLNEIMETKEFSQVSWLEELLQKGRDWIHSIKLFFSDLINGLFQADNAPVSLGWLFPVLLFLILLLALWWFGSKLIIHRELKGEGVKQVTQQKGGSHWIKRAEQAAAQGVYREAIRCLFQSVLERLDEQGVISRAENKTNLEYVEEVERHLPQQAPIFTELVRRFDHSWYGLATVNSAQYEQFYQVVRQIEGENQ